LSHLLLPVGTHILVDDRSSPRFAAIFLLNGVMV
jgi:hypothetical protein